MIARFKSIKLSEYWVLGVLTFVAISAFGLLLPELGFYWDDWMTIYLVNTHTNPGEFIYAAYRPLHAVWDVLAFKVLGNAPLGWHMLALVFRWGAAVLAWRVLLQVWPRKRSEAAWAAVLFLIYPIFFQQSSAVIYRPHWMTYCFYLLSLLFMLRAVREPDRFARYTLASLLFAGLHLFTTEYLVGLELLRPVLLLLVVSGKDLRERTLAAIRQYVWYPFVLAGFVIWRLFFVVIENDPNPIKLNPASGEAFGQLVQGALRDTLYVLFAAWGDLIKPELIDVRNSSGVLIWVGVAALAVVLWLVWGRLSFGEEEGGNHSHYHLEAMGVGLLGVVFGLAPAWVTGRFVLQGFFSDRLSLPPMFGAALFIVALVDYLVQRPGVRNGLLVVLVALSVGAHIRKGNDYRWDWQRQSYFFWQVYWRAPVIEPDTAIISDGAITSYASQYNVALALNTIYPESQQNEQAALWFFEYFQEDLPQEAAAYQAGERLGADFYSVHFEGSNNEVLFLANPPYLGRCTWVLTEKDVINPDVPPPMRELVGSSNLAQIRDVENVTSEAVLQSVFGAPPEGRWCYFYQKAELARTQSDWEQVLLLEQEADDLGVSPAHGESYELLPFIEAYLALEKWDAGLNLSIAAAKRSTNTDEMICALWERYESAASGYEAGFDELGDRIGCGE